MNVFTQSRHFAAGRTEFRPPWIVICAMAGLLSVVTFADQVSAQVVYRGYRPRGAVVVAPPIVPAPFYGSRWAPPPIVAGPPSSVRVRTPFFSLNIDPGGFVPPRYSTYGYPSYGFRYESYRPSYGYNYSAPSYRYRVTPRIDTGSPSAGVPDAYGHYRAGPGGGIPQVTTMPSFSLQELRRAAETLRDTIARRPDDGDVWLDYLQPDTIVADVVEGVPSESMPILLTRYDGVVRNPDLIAVTRLRGFHQTRQLLATWLQLTGQESAPVQPTVQPQPQGDRPRQPTPAAPAIPAQEGATPSTDIEPSPFRVNREPEPSADDVIESEEVLPGPREPAGDL